MPMSMLGLCFRVCSYPMLSFASDCHKHGPPFIFHPHLIIDELVDTPFYILILIKKWLEIKKKGYHKSRSTIVGDSGAKDNFC